MISFNRDQKFLVTGAGSGIGLATAKLLNELGATVIGLGRNEQKLESARNSCAAPEFFHISPFDLLDIKSIPELVAELRSEHGKFAGMCSSAGALHMDALRNFSDAICDEMYAINFQGPVALAKAITDRRNCIGAGASLVFIGALGGIIPQPGLLSYGAAKAALAAAVKSLSKELAPRRIRVNCISPGIVRTPMTEGGYASFMGYDVLAVEADNFPLGLGEPEDVASAAVFLLSDKARWITGQNLIMDGGRY